MRAFLSAVELVTVALATAVLMACSGAGGAKAPTPEYLGLEGQRVAVLVSAAPSAVLQATQAPQHLVAAISKDIGEHVPSALVVDPRQVVSFQERNPDWTVAPYGLLLERLGVARLVMVDLADYRLHEPGNIHLWQGAATAHVSVAATDAADPNNPVYATSVSVQSPGNQPLGALEGDVASMESGLNSALARRIALLFGSRKSGK